MTVTIAPPTTPPTSETLGPAPSPQGELVIPTGRPRIWFTSESLPAARTWAETTGWTPGDAPLEKAMSYLLTGNAAHGDEAIAFLMGVTLDVERSVSDDARWSGENALVIYDWVHDRLSAEQRETLVDRWNSYVEAFNAKSWGGPGMEANNYYWGYTRNTLLWAIASHGDNPRAGEFLDYFSETRWRDSFLPYAWEPGRGGVPVEATDYGQYMLRYPVMALASADCHGRSLWNETHFFKEAVMYLVYGTTPARTSIVDDAGGYQTFPFGDAHTWRAGSSAQSFYYGGFMTAAAIEWSTYGIGRYARHWLDRVGPEVEPYLAALDSGSEASTFDSLPLDYHAPGPQMVFARRAWDSSSSVLMAQLGVPENTDHLHADVGNFQFWRGGRWLTRESAGYQSSGQNLVGHAGSGTVDMNMPVAHNTLLFEGNGPVRSNKMGAGRIVRLESAEDYFYVAADLTEAFRVDTETQNNRPERDNPHVETLVREILYVRALEAVVVFDRLQSRPARGVAADATAKTFLMHFETEPVQGGGAIATATVGDQVVQVTTLHPETTVRRVIDEGDHDRAQYRLEVETSGEAQSYFLHLVEGRDAGASPLEVGLTDDGARFVITLEHPERGTSTITFERGATSTGGAIACTDTGLACDGLTPLRTGVQRSYVDDTGVVWLP
jgi:hypothetical protein